jgi:hypothetical protein
MDTPPYNSRATQIPSDKGKAKVSAGKEKGMGIEDDHPPNTWEYLKYSTGKSSGGEGESSEYLGHKIIDDVWISGNDCQLRI